MSDDIKSDFKYLAVRNWAKYQQRMKNGEVRRPFVRDAAAKDSDPDYARLTCVQRYILDGMRRLTALHGSNPPNDPLWVLRALATLPQDRPNAVRAIPQLVASGLLIPTNEKDPFSQVLNPGALTKPKGNELNELRESLREAPPQTHQDSNSKPVDGGDSVPSTPAETGDNSDAKKLCDLLSTYSGNTPTPEWERHARSILKAHKFFALEKVLEWMFTESDFWGERTHTMMNLAAHLEKGAVIKKFNAARAIAKKKAAKSSGLTDGATKRGDTIANRKESEI